MVDRGKIVVAGVIEEGEVIDGASGNDLGDLAVDEFSGDRFAGLFRDGDALVRSDELGNVALRRVMGDAAHGDVVALGEGDVENAGGNLGIVEEHFVEITEPVEEKDILGQRSPYGLILGHHRSEFLFACCHYWRE